MMKTLNSEMKSDSILVFQTLFAQNLAREPFAFSSSEEKDAFDTRVMFLKRYLMLLAICKVNFSESDNGTALKPWPFPLSSAISHGGRILLELKDVGWKELLNFLLWGVKATSQEFAQSPSPFNARMAATHGVVMDKDTMQLREVKLSGTATLTSNHYGMDMPVGGLGNPLPLHGKQGACFVGPAGVPYKKKDSTRRMSTMGAFTDKFLTSTHLAHTTTSDNNYVQSIQHGHLYMRVDDFGTCVIPRLQPSSSAADAGTFSVNEDALKAFVASNPSRTFNGLSIAYIEWEPAEIVNPVVDVAELLLRYAPNQSERDDTEYDDLKLRRLVELLDTQELLMEVKRDGSALRCRGNLLHVLFEFSDKEILVQTGATAAEEDTEVSRTYTGDTRSTPSHLLPKARGRSAVAEMKDVRVVTVLCRHNEVWTSALTRYCKEVLGLGEAACAYIIQSVDEHAKLYMTSPAQSVCFHHMEMCSSGIQLEYEALQLKVNIDENSRHLFESILPDVNGELRTTNEEHVELLGFSFLQTRGTIRRTWQWLTKDELSLIKVKGSTPPRGAPKLEMVRESVQTSSLLIGMESSAPLKEDIFGSSHGIDGKAKELSAFGKRKWRDYRSASQAMPADLGGMRTIVDPKAFLTLQEACSTLQLCQPSECFSQVTQIKEEVDVFKQLLHGSEIMVPNVLHSI